MAIVAVRETIGQGLHMAHSGVSSLIVGERIKDLEGGEVRRMGAATRRYRHKCKKPLQ
jgi:hypothetical protein